MASSSDRSQALSVASTDEIRSAFPALERRQNGIAAAYFDGPGGTQVPRAVVEAMNDYLFHHNANTHWAFPTSEETDAACRPRGGHWRFPRAMPTRSSSGDMTTLTFRVSRAIGRRLAPGDGNRGHRARPPCEHRPVASPRARARIVLRQPG